MKHDEIQMETLHEAARGPLERITFSTEDDGEKSLLTLIEEHRSQPSECPPATPSDIGSIYDADRLADVEEDESYRRDHLMMRLGGNGF